jgi:hypothetical protein
MAHPTRGHRSGTYEIEKVLLVDYERLELTLRHSGAFLPQVFHLSAVHTDAARQMLDALAASIKVSPNADRYSGWESTFTVTNGFFMASTMLAVLHDRGFSSLASIDIQIADLRALYQPLVSNQRRSAVWLLARVLRRSHPQGNALALALQNTRFAVDTETSPFTYDDKEAAAIERAARALLASRVEGQRQALASLEIDVSSRSWLRIPAEELIAQARSRHTLVCSPEALAPPAHAADEVLLAWLLTHPDRCGFGADVLPHNRLREMATAVYPDNVTIVAALVVHCLAENAGFNLSVLLEKSAESLTLLGPDHALEHNVKARNHSSDTRATRLASLYSSGGVLQAMTGLTRFSRHSREQLVREDGERPAVVDRIYVEHTPDPTRAEVIVNGRIHRGWRSTVWRSHWPEDAIPRAGIGLRMGALRLVAQRRAMGEGLVADVHGHTRRAKVHYLAHVLPDHLFHPLASAAQDEFHAAALSRFQVVSEASEGVALELAAADRTMVMDVEVGLCTSGGADPEDSEHHCALGITACFTCPNGFRTADHIPGLLAALDFADIIERNDPDEWQNGEASLLSHYAAASLARFAPEVVASVRRKTDLVPHVLTIAGMYRELRHG